MPERAKEFKKQYEAKRREALKPARESEDFRMAVEALGFGNDSFALAELRGRKFRGKRALKAFAGLDALRAPKPKNGPCTATGGACTEKCRHGQYNRRLRRMASSLAYTAIICRVEPWYSLYCEIKQALLKREALTHTTKEILWRVSFATRQVL